MRRPTREIQLTTYDELLGLTAADRMEKGQIIEVALEDLHAFRNHPFQVLDDEKNGGNR